MAAKACRLDLIVELLTLLSGITVIRKPVLARASARRTLCQMTAM
jgi:hypothetical protein